MANGNNWNSKTGTYDPIEDNDRFENERESTVLYKSDIKKVKKAM